MGRKKLYSGNEIWSRSCPQCSVEIVYKVRYQMIEAAKKGRKCVNCGCGWARGQTTATNESIRLNIERGSVTRRDKFATGKSIQWNKGLTAEVDSTIKHIAERHRGFKHSKETRELIGYHSKQRWAKGVYDAQFNRNRPAFKKYQSKVHRLTRKVQHLVEGYDQAMQGRMGISGAYQVDHIVDIKWGFDNNIPAEEIAAISNLQFIPWKENCTKAYHGKNKS